MPLGYLVASAMWMFSIEVKGGVDCGEGGLMGCAAQFLEEGVDVKVRALGRWMYGYLEKGIQTPLAQGRSTEFISMIN